MPSDSSAFYFLRYLMKTKDLLGILLFCIVFRAACTLLIVNQYPNNAYFLDLIFQAGMAVMLIVFCKFLMKISFLEIKNILGGKVGAKKMIFALASGVILVMFTMGENSIEAIIVAQFDPQKVFKIWNFHTAAQEIHPLFSLNVMSFLVVACLFAPVSEELFFRGFLLQSLLQKKSLNSTLMINCSIFTALHFSHEYYVSTFVFSLFLCCAYLITRSIVFCIVVHSTYNFLAFLQNYSLSKYFIRSIDNISSPSAWVPEIFSFVFSVSIISYFFFRFWRSVNYLSLKRSDAE